MRCLGRLVLAGLLILLLAAGWLYRGELTRYVRGVVDPMSIARRTGAPSPDALGRAEEKVAVLVRERPDSILLSADEVASLIARGSEILGQGGVDSVTVELGNRRIRVRAMIDTDRIPERWRRVIPGDPAPWEEVIAEGPLGPTRPGVAEWTLDRVIVRGLPLPAAVVARVLGRVTGRESDGRLTIGFPEEITGFRVRPEGVAIYRGGTP